MADLGLRELEAEAAHVQKGPNEAPSLGGAADLPAPALLASMLGNRAVSSLVAGGGSDPRVVSPQVAMLARGLQLARSGGRPEQGVLLRALEVAQEQPDHPLLTRPPAPGGARCSCGGIVLPGGECSKCMATRLTRQGMSRREVGRVVLARTKLARQETGKRSTLQCINHNLSNAGIPWAVITILGGVCGIIGALAGGAAGTAAAPGPGTAAGAAGGGAGAAAVCIAGVTGLAVGTVLGVITRCAQDPSVEWVFAQNEGAGAGEGGGEAGAEAVA